LKDEAAKSRGCELNPFVEVAVPEAGKFRVLPIVTLVVV
jgi:hypothetical protein